MAMVMKESTPYDPHASYRAAGVDTREADEGLAKITARLRGTWPLQGELGDVKIDFGYFANVIDIGGGQGIAVCTDGVGSKAMIAHMIRKYDTIGIDCIAMNVNDMICVGAKPLTLVDYIAIEQPDAEMLGSIAIGLEIGAKEAQVSISGGEISQLRDIVKGFDLVGTAVGTVALDRVLVGKDIQEDDVVIGIESNGVHSNGLSLARRTFFEGTRRFKPSHKFDELSLSLAEELLRPTFIYVREAMELIETCSSLKALINITSDGLLNMTRVQANVGFIIDKLPEPQPIFGLIQTLGDDPVAPNEMFEVYNMGVGFCVIVGQGEADLVIEILKKHGRKSQRIGNAVRDPMKKVHLTQHNLVGRGKTFRSNASGSR